MKKFITVLIALLFSFQFVSINGNKVSLTIDGNVLYVGGNGEGNYTSIQDAINDANNGYNRRRKRSFIEKFLQLYHQR